VLETVRISRSRRVAVRIIGGDVKVAITSLGCARLCMLSRLLLTHSLGRRHRDSSWIGRARCQSGWSASTHRWKRGCYRRRSIGGGGGLRRMQAIAYGCTIGSVRQTFGQEHRGKDGRSRPRGIKVSPWHRQMHTAPAGHHRVGGRSASIWCKIHRRRRGETGEGGQGRVDEWGRANSISTLSRSEVRVCCRRPG
jgi:hypothetical protein